MPRLLKRGALGSCCLSWGAETQQTPSLPKETSAEVPLPAKVLPWLLLSHCNAGWMESKRGSGFPWDMSGCLLLELVPGVGGAGEQLGRGVSWGWAMRAPALC